MSIIALMAVSISLSLLAQEKKTCPAEPAAKSGDIIAKELGIEIAMDFALQAAPDHPYVKEFPQWFKWRPDGTVQYAENPPKKYQDILPIYFESSDWKNFCERFHNFIF